MTMIGHNQGFVNVNSLSSNDKKELRDAIKELDASLTRAAAERDHRKTIIDDISDKLGLDKKLVRRMARAHFNANFNAEVESDKMFEEFYEIIINSNSNSSSGNG